MQLNREHSATLISACWTTVDWSWLKKWSYPCQQGKGHQHQYKVPQYVIEIDESYLKVTANSCAVNWWILPQSDWNLMNVTPKWLKSDEFYLKVIVEGHLHTQPGMVCCLHLKHWHTHNNATVSYCWTEFFFFLILSVSIILDLYVIVDGSLSSYFCRMNFPMVTIKLCCKGSILLKKEQQKIPNK